MIRLIFKTRSVTPEFFNVFNLILSFSTCSQSFKKICVWELLGTNVLKMYRSAVLSKISNVITDISKKKLTMSNQKRNAASFVINVVAVHLVYAIYVQPYWFTTVTLIYRIPTAGAWTAGLGVAFLFLTDWKVVTKRIPFIKDKYDHEIPKWG